MRVLSLAVVLILGTFVPTLGIAQIYKCVIDGQTIFQSAPCAGGVQMASPAATAPQASDYGQRRSLILRALNAKDFDTARAYARESWEREEIDSAERRWQEAQMVAAREKARQEALRDAQRNRPIIIQQAPRRGTTCIALGNTLHCD